MDEYSFYSQERKDLIENISLRAYLNPFMWVQLDLGFLDLYHCNFWFLENYHYYSSNWNHTITILRDSEEHHRIRFGTAQAHLQAYTLLPYLRMDKSAPRSSG